MIYAISNHKGGVGKTTSTINIGAAFANQAKKVLLIDLDPQANLTQSLNIKNAKITIDSNLKGAEIIPIEFRKNLHVIPSSLNLTSTEMELSSEPGREYILRDMLLPLESKFDYILIDCPPSLGLLTINALACADYAIIPMQAEYLPLRGLAKLTEIITKIQQRLNNNLKIGCVFLTQFDTRKILNRDIAQSVKDFFGDKFFETKISNNIALAEAPSQGKDIFSYNSLCKGAIDYQQLSMELIEKRIF